MSKRTIALSFLAGLAGGALTHYFPALPVLAQSQPAAAKEIRAERMILVNEKGVVLGSLTDEGGRPALRLYDSRGSEIWSAGGSIGMRRASAGK